PLVRPLDRGIPLHPTRRLATTSILVFTFVRPTLWRGLSLRLLAWGWLVALFILPEIAARKVLPLALVRTGTCNMKIIVMIFSDDGRQSGWVRSRCRRRAVFCARANWQLGGHSLLVRCFCLPVRWCATHVA
ncbi:hypothetical protein H4582DRAFT_2204204, partial [Lactarius indigo]